MRLEVHIKKKLTNFILQVDFETEEGVFALIGASGCGKSMTLKCIAGIETPDEGCIILNGRTLFDSKKHINLVPQKRNVGYMFQDYALFPNMTVEQNIQTGMRDKNKKQLALEYIKRFQLEGLEKQYPNCLSGGQRQRVAMARMLAAEPELLLLDEPFAALDTYLKWELEQQMRKMLVEAQKPAIFVSHNRDEVYRLCQTVGCMQDGKLEVVEPVKEFFQNPKTRVAAMLSGCKNIAEAKAIDANHLYIEDWDMGLCVSDIPKDTKYIGIRAHQFQPCTENAVNRIPVVKYEIIEEPFEWNVMVWANHKSRAFLWKIPKGSWNPDKDIPMYLTVEEQDILFLRDR